MPLPPPAAAPRAAPAGVFDDSDDGLDEDDVRRELSADAALSRALEAALARGSHVQPATLSHYEFAIARFAAVLERLHGPLRGLFRATPVVALAAYSLPELAAAATARMLDICLASVQHKPDSQLQHLSAALHYFTVVQDCAALNPFATTAVKWKRAALAASMRKLAGGRTHAPGISSDGLRRVVSWLVSAHPGDAARAPGGMSRAGPARAAREQFVFLQTTSVQTRLLLTFSCVGALAVRLRVSVAAATWGRTGVGRRWCVRL